MNLVSTLRPFHQEDFEALFAIDQSCFPRGIAYSRRTLRWFLALPGADCRVAEAANEIIGFILTCAEGQQGQVITLDVLAAHRRSGVGSLLLREAESRILAAGARAVTLETATNNHAAIAFWQKHGYRMEAVLRNYYLGTLDAFQMRKTFAPGPPPIREAL
jgi:ribosomal-protein-alanine N-acetyltransferase